MNLTLREEEVLALVATGLRNKDIGETLGIATDTVKNHLANIYRKHPGRSRMQLALDYAISVYRRHEEVSA